MYETVIVSNTKMLRWVPNPPPVLRAWVENPLSKFDSEPCYLLCEIDAVENGIAWVREVNSEHQYNAPISLLHCVHEFDIYENRLVKVYGEPKAQVL